jgi:NTE family protein
MRAHRSFAMKRIGLALGGGGAKGLCHIAFIQALDDLGIKPTVIAGTSIGAMIGAFYAAGLSGREMEDILRQNLRDIRRMMDVSLLPGSAAKRGRAVEALLQRFLPVRHLEELRIPLRVVATDFWNYRQVVLDSGELIPAIRASIAMAAVFEPVQMNGAVLVDGGGVNPLPYDIIQDRCDITVAIDVSGQKTPPLHDPVPNVFENMLTTYTILQSSIVKTKLLFSPPDIYLKPKLVNIRALDFHRCDDIISGVRQDVETLKDELKARLQRRSWFWRKQAGFTP